MLAAQDWRDTRFSYHARAPWAVQRAHCVHSSGSWKEKRPQAVSIRGGETRSAPRAAAERLSTGVHNAAACCGQKKFVRASAATSTLSSQLTEMALVQGALTYGLHALQGMQLGAKSCHASAGCASQLRAWAGVLPTCTAAPLPTTACGSTSGQPSCLEARNPWRATSHAAAHSTQRSRPQ